MAHVIYEPISKEKSKRILHQDYICKIDILKPNILQLKDISETINPEFSKLNIVSNSFKENEECIKKMICEIFNYAQKKSE